jgi:ABC-2 type transport system ATP-binding protein
MITVENLTKRYGSTSAVTDVSFTCEPGTVTGFLGPNGAGKSTTLRMLAGLTPPTSGSATVGGHRYRDLRNPGRVVGVMLDASAAHAGRTGRETLEVAGKLLRTKPGAAEAMLERVGLQDAGGRRVGQYSLGMRQRLGIGMALLGDPAALVLDEPANGLDPEGIRWMRVLLRDFADRGGTVLLSSHLLHEVQATADRLVVIGGGRVVADGQLAELLAGSGTRVRALDEPGLAGALAGAGFDVQPTADGGLLVDASAEQVGRVAAASGHVLLELRPADGGGLEQLFFELTADSADADARTDVRTERSAA